MADAAETAARFGRGMALMAASVALFPLGDALVRQLVPVYGIVQVAWARYLFHTVPILLLALGGRRGFGLATKRPGLQLVRGGLQFMSTGLIFGGLAFLPVTEVIALLFASPLFAVLLSIPILRERVGPHRTGAVLAGFLAVLIILRPGSDLFHWAGLLVVAGALCNALMQIVTRQLSPTEPPLTTLAWSGIVGFVPLTLMVPLVWAPPDATAWAMMAAMGVFGALAHLGMIRAINMAPVSVLAPFTYAQMPSAVAVDLLIFGDLPDRMTVLGIALVVAAGLYAWHRERLARGG